MCPRCDPRAAGYVRADGRLALSNGRIVANVVPDDERRRKLEAAKAQEDALKAEALVLREPEIMCSLCGTKPAARQCTNCGEPYCIRCYNSCAHAGARGRGGRGRGCRGRAGRGC